MTEENIICQNQNCNWIDLFLGIMFSPRATFKTIINQAQGSWCGIGGAAMAVCLTSAIDGLLSAGEHMSLWTPFIILFGIVFGLVGWLIFASAIAIPAFIFGIDRVRIRTSYITTGWAFLPWLFMAPLLAYRHVFANFSIVIALIPVLWILYLQCLALKESYQLTFGRTVALVMFFPQLIMISYFWWLIQILGNGISFLVH